jgi:GNAT superfamily N-acetyltransferase
VASTAEVRHVDGILARAFSLPEDAVQRTWGAALLDAPGFTLFLASDGETPLSTVTTCQHGPTVGIWSMATVPEAQRHGIGTTLLTEVLAQHRAAGARLFYLAASEAGYPLYQRVGFRTVETMTLWIAGDADHAHS